MSSAKKQPVTQIPIAEATLRRLAADSNPVYFPLDGQEEAFARYVGFGWFERVNHGGYGYRMTTAGIRALRLRNHV